jgi:hypothetical protein
MKQKRAIHRRFEWPKPTPDTRDAVRRMQVSRQRSAPVSAQTTDRKCANDVRRDVKPIRPDTPTAEKNGPHRSPTSSAICGRRDKLTPPIGRLPVD